MMVLRRFQIRGSDVDDDLSELTDKLSINIKQKRRIMPGSARDGVTGEKEVASDEVVRVKLENGFDLWSRADDLVSEYGRRSSARDGRALIEFDRLLPKHHEYGMRDERGLIGLGIKFLDFFDIDLAEKSASMLCKEYENKTLEAGESGLYRCSLNDGFKLGDKVVEAFINPGQENAHKKMLIFIHGTASNCEGSFGALWDINSSEGKRLREGLKDKYDEVYAFEHRSLTESPITNALELAQRLPKHAEIDLVSHSRGGLIGELFCLGGCESFGELDLDSIFDPDHSMLADQIGLSSLNDAEISERKDAYSKDVEKLKALIQLFKERSFKIKRFVRVACPARGTTLASGRLDRWLSMFSYLAGSGVVGDALGFILAVVKKRTDPRTLPGLEAMMPGSALIRLLNHPKLVTPIDLTVISGEIEADTACKELVLWAANSFFGDDHDLIVNTGSMAGGLKRKDGTGRFRKMKGGDVNHFSYFKNAESVGWLQAGLMREEGDPGGFISIDRAPKKQPRWRSAIEHSRDVTLPRPFAIVLPGIMGSNLKVGDHRVWLSYLSLALGGLGKLSYGENDANVDVDDLIDDFYAPMLEFLAVSHQLEVFPYDWRHSVRDAAKRLARKLEEILPKAERQKQPIHLVAHSMGGLVVRAMIADEHKGAEIWQRIIGLPNSRFLMLGTPNFGSYEAVRWLTGFNPTQAKLATLDFTRGVNGIIDIVRHFPGLLELLPSGDGDDDFTDKTLWQNIKKNIDAKWNTVDENNLRAIASTWRLLNKTLPDPRYTAYVAGCQPATIIRHQFSDDEKSDSNGRKRLDFIATSEGDGTVSWLSGKLNGIGMWYVENTAHDALCVQTRAFPGYLDLLLTGKTSRLSATPPVSRRSVGEARQEFFLPQTPLFDSIPNEEEVRRLGFGTSLTVSLQEGRPAAPIIRVCIRHGNLSYARHPVMVGHYLGDTIASAEKALDKQLKERLSKRLDLGIYPGQMDTHALFFNEKIMGKPGGAIVVGLGQVGELTPGLLETCVRHALLDYALQVSQWPDERFGKIGTVRSAAISCPIVGSGAGGLPLRDSIEAILRGATGVNAKLAIAGLEKHVIIDEIEFIEVFDDLSIEAAEALQRVLKDGELAMAIRWSEEVVEEGQAGRRRIRFEDAQDWWHRLEIIEEEDRPNQLRFIATTDRARAEETLATGQLALAESFIAQVSDSPISNPEAARTLFEMLLPLRLREMAPRQVDLVLLLDERSARYPWELLENRWSDNGKPAAVNVGLIRQFKTRDFRSRPAHAIDDTALVIGNPDLSDWNRFSDLHGARNEANAVARALRNGHEKYYDVCDCIDKKTNTIIEHLHRKAWRILHLAGHGVHDFPLGKGQTATCHDCKQPRTICQCCKQPQAISNNMTISGMVIGPNTFLTPGDIRQMRWVPELVFINCCHLGKVSGNPQIDRGGLAANLGLEFINMGVRAVIAAGWAVDDAAAQAFAEVFYELMLSGERFGEAVRAARKDIWLRFQGINTWGAYQCYGDPSFRLCRDGLRASPKSRVYMSPKEPVIELENLVSELQANGATHPGVKRNPVDRISFIISCMPEKKREEWLGRADVSAALGLAYGEAQSWSKAIEKLEESVKADKGDCPIRVLEQLANFKIRHAVEQWLAAFDKCPDTANDEAIRIIQCEIIQLKRLMAFGETAERMNLLGGAYKRLAWIQSKKAGIQSKDACLSALEACLRPLTRMKDYYHKSYQKDEEPYPFSCWALAGFLIEFINPSSDNGFKIEVFSKIIQVEESVKRKAEIDPHFWESANLVNLNMIRLLNNPNNSNALEKQIIEDYRNAIERGASPNQIASVKEHLDFIIAILARRSGKDLHAIFRRIRASI